MTCTACTAPTATGITLCAADVARLADVLDEIPDALDIVEDTIARTDQTSDGAATAAGSAESQAPINLTASERRTALWEGVVSWAREVLEHDESDDLAGVEPVTYLRMSTDLIQHHDFAGELLDEIEHHWRQVMRVADIAPDIVVLGQCGVVHEEEPCPGQLRARRGEHEARCKVCGATHGVAETQQARAAEAWEHYAPLTQVVDALRQAGFRINPKSAQRWATRGEMPVLRYRKDGVALYSPGQVVHTHQRMQQRRGRPRAA